MRFDDGFSASTCRLFEFDEKTLQAVLANDGGVSIKGAQPDEAVLCTKDATFVIRLAESSNTFLLASSDAAAGGKPGEEPVHVHASVSAHFETIRIAARPGPLLKLLRAFPYSGGGARDSDVSGGVTADPPIDATGVQLRRLTLAELEGMVQCSSGELRAALQAAHALDVDGHWCVLDAQLERDLVECITALCIENEWPLDAVPTGRCVEICMGQLEGVDELSVRHCLRTHSTLAAADWETWCGATSVETIALSADTLTTAKAQTLLASCDAWPQDKFFEEWAELLPPGCVPALSHLAGLAVIMPSGGGEAEQPTVQALDVGSLSAVPKERFAALFRVKKVWTMAELEPYVNDILDPGCAPTKLVLQYARSMGASDGEAKYVSR